MIKIYCRLRVGIPYGWVCRLYCKTTIKLSVVLDFFRHTLWDVVVVVVIGITFNMRYIILYIHTHMQLLQVSVYVCSYIPVWISARVSLRLHTGDIII